MALVMEFFIRYKKEKIENIANDLLGKKNCI